MDAQLYLVHKTYPMLEELQKLHYASLENTLVMYTETPLDILSSSTQHVLLTAQRKHSAQLLVKHLVSLQELLQVLVSYQPIQLLRQLQSILFLSLHLVMVEHPSLTRLTSSSQEIQEQLDRLSLVQEKLVSSYLKLQSQTNHWNPVQFHISKINNLIFKVLYMG